MRRYETFVIIDPDISQDERDPLIEKVKELIGQMDGFLVFTDDWGEKKLAYEISKKERGYYVRFDYCGLAPLVNEIERFFRIAESESHLEDAPKEKQEEVETAAAEEEIKEESKAEEVVPSTDAEDPAAETTPSKHPEEA